MGIRSRSILSIPKIDIIHIHLGNQAEAPEAAWVVNISGYGIWNMSYSRGVLSITPHLTAGDLGILRVTIGDLMRSMNPDYDRRTGLIVVSDDPTGASAPTHVAASQPRPSRRPS